MRVFSNLMEIHALTGAAFAELLRLTGRGALRARLSPYHWSDDLADWDKVPEEEVPHLMRGRATRISLTVEDLPAVGPYAGVEFEHPELEAFFRRWLSNADVHLDVRLAPDAPGTFRLEVPPQTHLRLPQGIEPGAFPFAPADAPKTTKAPQPRDEAFLRFALTRVHRGMRRARECQVRTLLFHDFAIIELVPGCLFQLMGAGSGYASPLLIADPARYAWAWDLAGGAYGRAVIPEEGLILADLGVWRERSDWERRVYAFAYSPNLLAEALVAVVRTVGGHALPLEELRPFVWERYVDVSVPDA